MMVNIEIMNLALKNNQFWQHCNFMQLTTVDTATAWSPFGQAVIIAGAAVGPMKARRILEILKIVHGDFGAYSIAELAKRGRDEARRYLTALPGVGEKTAACVLMFDMALPAFPVDTHVSRVCRRVGFVPEKASPDDICALMEREVPPRRYLGGHVNIIEHGRAVCSARKPLCGACPLTALCNTGRERVAEAMAAEMRKGRPGRGRARKGGAGDDGGDQGNREKREKN